MNTSKPSSKTHDGKEALFASLDGLNLQKRSMSFWLHAWESISGRYLHLRGKGVTENGCFGFHLDGRGPWQVCLMGNRMLTLIPIKDYRVKDIDALFGKVRSYVPESQAFLYGSISNREVELVAAYVLGFQPEGRRLILKLRAGNQGAEGNFKIIDGSRRHKWVNTFPPVQSLEIGASKDFKNSGLK